MMSRRKGLVRRRRRFLMLVTVGSSENRRRPPAPSRRLTVSSRTRGIAASEPKHRELSPRRYRDARYVGQAELGVGAAFEDRRSSHAANVLHLRDVINVPYIVGRQ
jgi:hypothetical protein